MVIVVIILFSRIPSFADQSQTIGISCAAYRLCITPKCILFIRSLYKRLAVSALTVCGVFCADAVCDGSGTNCLLYTSDAADD